MKARVLFLLAMVLVGCASKPVQTRALTPAEAGELAQKLANQKAQGLYNCQPFRQMVPAQWVQGHWVWRDREGYGNGDVEASVRLASDGTSPEVNVDVLYSSYR